jgi:hypothetical protein
MKQISVPACGLAGVENQPTYQRSATNGSMADAEDAVQETHLCWHAAVVAAMRRASDIGRDHEGD